MAKDGKLGLIIGIGPKPKSSSSNEESPSRLAAAGVLEAIANKDTPALEEALRTAFDAWQADKAGEDEEMDEGESD